MKQQKQRKKKSKKYNSLWRLIGLTTNCGLSAFYYGYCVTYFNAIAFKDIVRIYHIQSFPKAATQGFLTGCISFTGAFGSILSVLLVDRFSRRKCLGFMSLLAIILSLISLIPNIWIFALVRLLQGLVIGTISCITPLYISQMMPKSVSGPFWSYHQCLFVLGITFSFVLAAICQQFATPETYWRIVFGFPIITSLIQVYNFAYVFYNESPKFLVMHDQQQQAKQTLRYLYKQKYVQRVFHEIVEAVEYAQQSSSSEQQQLNPLEKPLHRSIQRPDSVQLKPIKPLGSIQNKRPRIGRNVSLNQMLLQANLKKKHLHEHREPNNRVALISAVYLSVQQAFMGGPSVINYSGDLIEGIFPKYEHIFPIFINVTGIFGSLLSIYILAKAGRRKIILAGTLGEGICLFIAFVLFFSVDYQNPFKAPYSTRLTIAILFILIRVILAATFAPVADLYSAEIIQPQASAWCNFCQWVSMGFVTSFFPAMCGLANGNPIFAFGLFSIITLASFFVNRMTIIQTKNKTEIQIRKQFDQKFPG